MEGTTAGLLDPSLGLATSGVTRVPPPVPPPASNGADAACKQLSHLAQRAGVAATAPPIPLAVARSMPVSTPDRRGACTGLLIASDWPLIASDWPPIASDWPLIADWTLIADWPLIASDDSKWIVSPAQSAGGGGRRRTCWQVCDAGRGCQSYPARSGSWAA